eukprot:9625825-Heterocapsa_arctica.AAC.1
MPPAPEPPPPPPAAGGLRVPRKLRESIARELVSLRPPDRQNPVIAHQPAGVGSEPQVVAAGVGEAQEPEGHR